MDVHTDTLTIVRDFIRSFYRQNTELPLISDILNALKHPEMDVYQRHFLTLIQNLPTTCPIDFNSKGWLIVEVVHNPQCYHCIPVNSSPAR